jgi:hypothetical protein
MYDVLIVLGPFGHQIRHFKIIYHKNLFLLPKKPFRVPKTKKKKKLLLRFSLFSSADYFSLNGP